MTLRRLLLPTMIAAALAVPASAQDMQGQGQERDAPKADAKAQQARKDAQAGQQKDRKAEDATKARKAKAEEQPDEPEEDDR